MGAPFTPPNSSSRTPLSWLLPQPPAKSTLLCDLDLEVHDEGRAAELLLCDDIGDKVKADATSNEQAIAITMAASVEGLALFMVLLLVCFVVFFVDGRCSSVDLRRGTP